MLLGGQADALQKRQISDLPTEVLKKILVYVLAEYKTGNKEDEEEGLKVVSPVYNIDADRSNCIGGDRNMPVYTTLKDRSLFHLPQHTLSTFLLSKEWYIAGSAALYSLYKFQSFSAESFRCLFTKLIGQANLGCIRRLTLGLPYCLVTMPSKYLKTYRYLLRVQMPQLRELVFTTTLDRWRYPYLKGIPSTSWQEKHRAMLFAPAWIVPDHPWLKFVVWDEENTVVDGKLDDERYEWFDQRETVRLTVTMAARRPGGLQYTGSPDEIRKFNETKTSDDDEKEILPVKVSASLRSSTFALTEI